MCEKYYFLSSESLLFIDSETDNLLFPKSIDILIPSNPLIKTNNCEQNQSTELSMIPIGGQNMAKAAKAIEAMNEHIEIVFLMLLSLKIDNIFENTLDIDIVRAYNLYYIYLNSVTSQQF